MSIFNMKTIYKAKWHIIVHEVAFATETKQTVTPVTRSWAIDLGYYRREMMRNVKIAYYSKRYILMTIIVGLG